MLLNATGQIDNISNRCLDYDVSNVVLSLLVENLIRQHQVSVHFGSFIFISQDESIPVSVSDIQRVIQDIISVTQCNSIFKGYNNNDLNSVLLYGNDCVLEITYETFYDNLDGYQKITNINVKLYTLYYESMSSLIIECMKQYGLQLSKDDTKEDKIRVYFSVPKHTGGIQTYAKQIPKLPLDTICRNYNDSVVTAVRQLIVAIKKSKNGLVILHGPVGTGKSYLIKSILSELGKERSGIVCTPPLIFLEDTSYLNQTLSEFQSSMLIFEDVGDILSTDNVTMRPNVTSNLLNLTEGLMSILANTIVLVTFNYEIGKISDALTRPGRCIAKIKVDYLSGDRAAELTGLPLDKNVQYNLAEVYEMLRTGAVLDKKVLSVFSMSR